MKYYICRRRASKWGKSMEVKEAINGSRKSSGIEEEQELKEENGNEQQGELLRYRRKSIRMREEHGAE
jgi:hypothetical protein